MFRKALMWILTVVINATVFLNCLKLIYKKLVLLTNTNNKKKVMLFSVETIILANHSAKIYFPVSTLTKLVTFKSQKHKKYCIANFCLYWPTVFWQTKKSRTNEKIFKNFRRTFCTYIFVLLVTVMVVFPVFRFKTFCCFCNFSCKLIEHLTQISLRCRITTLLLF